MTVAPLRRRHARPVFPLAQAAWDYWHANGDGETPVPSHGKRKEAP